jgi:TusA-related sulfurtransferase
MIEKIDIGDTIQIIATDLGVLHDIPAWCKVHDCDEKKPSAKIVKKLSFY